jgi:hypothetical protein
MTAHSRATGPPDLVGDRVPWAFGALWAVGLGFGFEFE